MNFSGTKSNEGDRVVKANFRNYCSEKADTKILVQYFYDKNCKSPEDVAKRWLDGDEAADFVLWQRKRGGRRYRYGMITINFREGTRLEDIIKKVNKLVKRTFIMSAVWCFEWRNSEEKTPHVHMRVEFAEKANVYKTRGLVYNTVKNFVGNKMHVHVVYSNDEGAFIKYILGEKDGKWKPTHSIDVLKRNQLNLKDHYTFSNVKEEKKE